MSNVLLLPPEPINPVLKVASANGAAQTNAPAFAAVAGKTNYLAGFDVNGSGATGASVILVTITGLLGGTIVYALPVVAGVAAPVNPNGGLSIRFPYPIPASAVNTAITVSCPTFGSGNTAASVNMYGFYI